MAAVRCVRFVCSYLLIGRPLTVAVFAEKHRFIVNILRVRAIEEVIRTNNITAHYKGNKYSCWKDCRGREG